jgi:glycosyltransferase involved in cell wall biosynthesis
VAAALAAAVPTRLVAPVELHPGDLAPWIADRDQVLLHHEPPPRSRWDDLRLALRDRRDLLTVVQSPYLPRATGARRAALLVDFPFGVPSGRADRIRLARYQHIIVNSAFTGRWVAARWGREATVVPPPVPPVQPAAKERLILSVGRFSGGARTKGQLPMVEAFRRLGPEVHRQWTLHLAGFVEDPAALAEVRQAATDLPVHLHPDLSRPDLDALYGRASLYWHACGLGADPVRNPEHLEHFGIAVVEAMSAAAVPLVYGAGGPPEIVGDAGQTWHTVEELVQRTRALVGPGAGLQAAAARAQHAAGRFAPAEVAPRLRQALGFPISPPPPV